MRVTRARKTALINVLDQLGVALALSGHDSPEAALFRRLTPPYALGRYSDCLDWYQREAGADETIPSTDELINLLGGPDAMARMRATRSADERYPDAMRRLRRLIADLPDGTVDSQLAVFLERVTLSSWDGHTPDRDRVNLLTLHSTKGLEFSRVYVVGAEDAQLPGGSQTSRTRTREIEEARRLLYVGMTRTIDRLVLTRVGLRGGRPTGGHQFLDEMGLRPVPGP
jgi:superfamily I DNA/RNA helicase